MIEKLNISVLESYHITNCYIVWDEKSKEAVIVDPADREDIIFKKIEELGVSVKYIALTHAHKDHTIALQSVIEKYNVKVIASILEKEMLEGKYSDSSEVFGLKQKKYNTDDFIFLENNSEFLLGEKKIKIIYTPGHTKGSVCYYIADENAMLTGDTLFADCFGRCDLDTASIDDMVESLCTLYKNYKEVNIYPGHGETNLKLINTYENVKRILKHSFNINIDNLIN